MNSSDFDTVVGIVKKIKDRKLQLEVSMVGAVLESKILDNLLRLALETSCDNMSLKGKINEEGVEISFSFSLMGYHIFDLYQSPEKDKTIQEVLVPDLTQRLKELLWHVTFCDITLDNTNNIELDLKMSKISNIMLDK